MGKEDDYEIVRKIIDRDPNTQYGCERQGCLILDLHKTFQVSDYSKKHVFGKVKKVLEALKPNKRTCVFSGIFK